MYIPGTFQYVPAIMLWCADNTPDYAHKGQGPYLISVGLPVRARCPCRGSSGFLNVTALDTAASTGLSNPRKRRVIAISIAFCIKFPLSKETG